MNKKKRPANALEEIYKSSLRLLEPLTSEKTYEIILEEALRLGGGKIGSVLLEKEGVLFRVYSNSKLLHRIKPRERGFLNTAYRKNKPQIITTEQIAEAHPEIKEAKIKTDILIPLTYKKKQIGLLTVLTSETKEKAEKRMDILKLFGPFATIAIIKAQLYNETKSALTTRDLFISMAAHELRTPTTTIQGYIQLMQKKYVSGKYPPKKWVDIVEAETVRLNNLLRELLKVEQVRSGKLKFEWKENKLIEIIQRVIAYFKINYPNYKIVFENRLEGEKDVVLSDFDKLLQSIINLVNNAVKFSELESEIKIILSYEKPYYRIAVKDQGKGIPKRDMPHVFEGFYKGRDHTKEGMGLGLFLAQNIIEGHRGFMNIKSRVGKGTVVEINIPKK